MARRRFQTGQLYKSGKRRKVWTGRWYEMALGDDGQVRQIRRAVILGPEAEIPTKREAQARLDELLRPVPFAGLGPAGHLRARSSAHTEAYRDRARANCVSQAVHNPGPAVWASGHGYVNSAVQGVQNVVQGGRGFCGQLASFGQQDAANPEVWKAGPGAIAAAAEAAAKNRSARLDREGATLSRLQIADYLENAEGYTPRNRLPSYVFGPRPSSPNVRKAADDLLEELLKRLAQSGEPSLWERIAGVAPAMVVYGASRSQQPRQ